MPQIVLTGFMGTGKTQVGRRLARLLGRPFIDIDDLIEAAAGRTVAEIFATEGEPRFRMREREAVEQACGVPEAVIATGGGTVMDPENRRRLAAAGPIVCLSARPEDILRRVGNPAARPLLAGARDERLSHIQSLLAARASAYALAAHTIDTTGLTLDQVVERVRHLVAGR